MRALMPLLALLIPVAAPAASVYKCVGPDGTKSFSHFACPDSSPGEEVKVQVGSAGMRIADPAALPAPQDVLPSEGGGGIRVSGTKAASGSKCGDADEQEIRTAVVKNQVFPGMSAEDALKSWGKPSKINQSSHGTDQWVYYRGDYSAQYLYVDSSGCVKSWN